MTLHAKIYNGTIQSFVLSSTSLSARRCTWNFKKIFVKPWYLKKFQPIRPSRLVGYKEHIYQCLVLLYRWFSNQYYNYNCGAGMGVHCAYAHSYLSITYCLNNIAYCSAYSDRKHPWVSRCTSGCYCTWEQGRFFLCILLDFLIWVWWQ